MKRGGAEMTERETLAEALWRAGALELTSGKMPLRWNGEAALRDEETRTILLNALETMVRDHYGAAQALLGGKWAELLSGRLGLPVNPAELPERPLVIAEAVVDGEELHALAAPLRREGRSVAAAALFNYGLESARRLLDRADVRLHWLTDLETASAVALQTGQIDFSDYDRLLELRSE